MKKNAVNFYLCFSSSLFAFIVVVFLVLFLNSTIETLPVNNRAKIRTKWHSRVTVPREHFQLNLSESHLTFHYPLLLFIATFDVFKSTLR